MMGYFNIEDYEPVASRLDRFWKDHDEDGKLKQNLISHVMGITLSKQLSGLVIVKLQQDLQMNTQKQKVLMLAMPLRMLKHQLLAEH
jgi:hypothetical protein